VARSYASTIAFYKGLPSDERIGELKKEWTGVVGTDGGQGIQEECKIEV